MLCLTLVHVGHAEMRSPARDRTMPVTPGTEAFANRQKTSLSDQNAPLPQDRDMNRAVDKSLSGDSALKIVSTDQILEDIRRIEFDQIRYDVENPEYFGFIKGKIPVLISAPHGAKHFRRRWNRWKGEDEYTASLAIELARLTGAYVIYVKNKAPEDPNNDPVSRYKTAVAEAVRKYRIEFLLDLHGSAGDRPFKVDVGIISEKAGGTSCSKFKKAVIEALSGFESPIFNKHFCAADANTLTYFARHQLGIEAAQVEINAHYRIVERKPESCKAKAGVDPHFRAKGEDVIALVERLARLIQGVQNTIKESGACKVDPIPPIKSSARGAPDPLFARSIGKSENPDQNGQKYTR
jgi:hypothetical protein